MALGLPRRRGIATSWPEWLVSDATARGSGRREPRTRRAAARYVSQLRQIGQHVGHVISGFDPLADSTASTLTQVLQAYAQALTPWARATAMQMILEVDRRDRQAWQSLGTAISAQLRNDLLRTPIGDRVRQLLDEQVHLIRSIPVEAAQRVHRLTIAALENSERAAAIEQDIRRSGAVSASKATLIARTETSRTGTVLLQARCEANDITHYIWRTAHDRDVRPGHRRMEGRVCAWDDPPEVDEGTRLIRHHPGAIWNCRCFAEPIINDPGLGQKRYR